MIKLKLLKPSSFAYRRLRGDMTEVYKIIYNIYNHTNAPNLVEIKNVTKNTKQGTFNKITHPNSKIKSRKKCISNYSDRTTA